MPVPLRYRVHRRVVDESGDRVGLCLRHLAEWRNRRPRGGYAVRALPDEELRRRDYALAALPGSDVLRRLVAAEQTRRRRPCGAVPEASGGVA